MINKNTVVGISIGTLGSVLVGMWLLVAEVHAWVSKIEANTNAIAMLSSDVKLSRVYDMIGDLRRERRGLIRDLELQPEDRVIQQQIEDVEDEIEMLERVLDCLMAGNDNCVRDG